MKRLMILLVLCLPISVEAKKFEGLAPTPPMGWNSWNTFGTNINEKLIKENQTDKDKTLIYLYATDPEKQYSYIESARNKGYDVLLLDGQLDTHFINHLEQKFKGCRFTRDNREIIIKVSTRTTRFD